MSGSPDGFAFTERSGAVVVTHRGRQAATLRGERAARFLADVERDDPQQVMARVTGNYKRGNERRAAGHARNQQR